jgi:hypothetical protein
MASRAEKTEHIAQAFEDAFRQYIDRKGGDGITFFPPPASFDVWEDEAQYRVCTRVSFASGERVDLSFTAFEFSARDFAFVSAPAILALWSSAYAKHVNQDFRADIREMRRCAERAHSEAVLPSSDIMAPSATAAILSYPLSPSHVSRLSDVGAAFHRERGDASAWSWRPDQDVFTRLHPTPAALMQALLHHEGRRNFYLRAACDVAKRAIDLAHITPQTASWAETIRAMLAQVFPSPDIEQEAAMGIALADPYFCDWGGGPGQPRRQENAARDRQGWRAQYEQRWDMAAAYQRRDPVAAQQDLLRNLARDLNRQTLAALMGGQLPLTPGELQGGLSDAHLRAMEDAATYGMGIVNNGPECTGYIAREQLMRFPSFYGAARVRETAAEARAEKLLRENLSDSQLSQLDANGCFDVMGGSSGKTYRITRGRQMNVYQLDKNGRRVRGLCFMPEGNLVPGDVMLIQKLSLELNESKAIATANVF